MAPAVEPEGEDDQCHTRGLSEGERGAPRGARLCHHTVAVHPAQLAADARSPHGAGVRAAESPLVPPGPKPQKRESGDAGDDDSRRLLVGQRMERLGGAAGLSASAQCVRHDTESRTLDVTSAIMATEVKQGSDTTCTYGSAANSPPTVCRRRTGDGIVSETTTVAGLQRELGSQLDAFRKVARVTQDELASATGYSRSSIANIQAGRQRADERFWRRCDEVLNASGALLKAWARTEEIKRQIYLEQAERTRQRQEAELSALRANLATDSPPEVPQQRAPSGLQRNEVADKVIHQAFEPVAGGGDVGLGENDVTALEQRALAAFHKNRADHDRLSLTLIGGYAGSGKSEFANFLSSITGWPIFDKDILTRALVEQVLLAHGRPVHDRESAVYLEKVRPYEYRCLFESGRQNLRCGISTILCAPFLREFKDPAWLSRVKVACQQTGAELHVVWLRCDAESMFDYITFRGAARDTWKLSNWEEYLAGVDLDFQPACEHYVVDNSMNAAVALADRAGEVARQMRVGEP